MQRRCKKSCKIRYAIAAMISAGILSGCGTVLAGTTVELDTPIVQASSSGEVTWFDGIQVRTASIQIGKCMEIGEAGITYDDTLIPQTEVSQLRCFQIMSKDDITGLDDMQILDSDGNPIIFVSTVYDGAVYPLGYGWYGIILPNGFNEPFSLRVGNTYFEMR